jgi:hypothetical protein
MLSILDANVHGNAYCGRSRIMYVCIYVCVCTYMLICVSTAAVPESSICVSMYVYVYIHACIRSRLLVKVLLP